jgi:16S rRNA (cytidine1402-2'-O)-methyltransferase
LSASFNLNPTPTLYLFPTLLSDEAESNWLAVRQFELMDAVNIWFVENERSARRFLRKTGYRKDFDTLPMRVLDKNTESNALKLYIKELSTLGIGAILSEAGCPGIADPGAALVSEAQKQGIDVVALSGPSSILLTLMASGLNGQHFTFHGYLPIKPDERLKKIKALDAEVQKNGSAQIFIETPYRNNALLNDLTANCNSEHILCIGKDLTANQGWTRSKKIKDWSISAPDLHKIPAVFILGKNVYHI